MVGFVMFRDTMQRAIEQFCQREFYKTKKQMFLGKSWQGFGKWFESPWWVGSLGGGFIIVLYLRWGGGR